VLRKITNEPLAKLQKGDETFAGVIKMVKVLRRHEAPSCRSATRWPAVTGTRV